MIQVIKYPNTRNVCAIFGEIYLSILGVEHRYFFRYKINIFFINFLADKNS